ncbi:hypothetical protein ACFQX6_64935 [Streptosporangium lutulentum]
MSGHLVQGAAAQRDLQPNALPGPAVWADPRRRPAHRRLAGRFGRSGTPVPIGTENAFGEGGTAVPLRGARGDAIREQRYVRTLLSRRMGGLIAVGER